MPVEFGLCREGTELKAYGAGLLSSFGELEYCLTDKPEVLPFDPHVTGKTKYPITTVGIARSDQHCVCSRPSQQYQPKYFVASSFQDATRLMRQFAAQSDRPFSVHYNPYTQSIEVLDSLEKLASLANNVQQQAALLSVALAGFAADRN